MPSAFKCVLLMLLATLLTSVTLAVDVEEEQNEEEKKPPKTEEERNLEFFQSLDEEEIEEIKELQTRMEELGYHQKWLRAIISKDRYYESVPVVPYNEFESIRDNILGGFQRMIIIFCTDSSIKIDGMFKAIFDSVQSSYEELQEITDAQKKWAEEGDVEIKQYVRLHTGVLVVLTQTSYSTKKCIMEGNCSPVMKQWFDENEGEKSGSISLKYYRNGDEQVVPLF